MALSPLALINAWYIKNPPWKQVERDANNADKLDPKWEEIEQQCRAVMELRMRLVPYLHAAFVRYRKEGLPPFRALVMDYPRDVQTWTVDDEYLIGESLLVAPVVAGQSGRSVYLPQGEWFDFWTRQRHPGGRKMTVETPLDRIPLFVKSGTLLPLAQATTHTEDSGGRRLTIQVYGTQPSAATLYEDDDSWDPALAPVTLRWDSVRQAGSVDRSGSSGTPRYEAIDWTVIR